jgi:hypothetical protein
MPGRLMAACTGLALTASLVSAGCGELSGKQAEERRRAEHPCQFSATSARCQQQLSLEKKQEEARHETRVLRERARVEAERNRLNGELSP